MSNLPPERSDNASKNRIADASDGQADPLASLYKMSRTAGLGSQEYVAVNTTAVAALLLGFASSLAMVANLLLIIPLATLIIAIIAIVQIRRSAGTQTGKGLALMGLLLAGGFVLFVGGRAVMHAREARREEAAIIALIDQFGKYLSQGNYDAAWAQFSARFHERVKKDDFVALWTRYQADDVFGKIQSMRWNGILEVEPQADTRIGKCVIVIDLPHIQAQDRELTSFRWSDDQGWQIDDIPKYFPPTPERGQ
jgi:hypothetical protein